jgi:hypothetical protein
MDLPQNTENFTLLGAGLTAVIALLYKLFRIFKSDRSLDSLNQDELEFRKLLLEENKSLRELNNKLYIEKAELMSEIAMLKEKNNWLERSIHSSQPNPSSPTPS